MGCARCLDLARPIYQKSAAYGHFGRTEPEFTWEKTDRAEALAADGKSVRACLSKQLTGFHRSGCGGAAVFEERCDGPAERISRRACQARTGSDVHTALVLVIGEQTV